MYDPSIQYSNGIHIYIYMNIIIYNIIRNHAVHLFIFIYVTYYTL